MRSPHAAILGLQGPDYYYYISCYAIAISAIGPAPQAVTKKSEVEQKRGTTTVIVEHWSEAAKLLALPSSFATLA